MKCPFAAPLTRSMAACRHAREVVRRGGTEIDCGSEPAHVRCAQVFDGLKACALVAFDVEDDPAQMPHSVLVKVQSGGLLGLQRLLAGAADTTRISDVGDLIAQAVVRYGNPEAIPYRELEDDMLSFQLERRSGRRRG